MKKELSKSFLLLKTSIKKHSPEILTGIGIAGMITTTVMAVRATPKALILIEERKEEIGVNQLEAVDLIKTTWMCYVPAALTGTLSIACLIGASSVNVRRNAALATAYTLSESALKDYQENLIAVYVKVETMVLGVEIVPLMIANIHMISRGSLEKRIMN